MEHRRTDKARARAAAYRRKNRKTPQGRAQDLVTQARRRAKRDGLPFDLTPNIIKVLLQQTNNCCCQTGLPFDFEPRSDVTHNPLAPSLDQIYAGRGYTKENIQIVCDWYNRAKSQMRDAEVQQYMTKAVEHFNKMSNPVTKAQAVSIFGRGNF